jgi:hypothetical protein
VSQASAAFDDIASLAAGICSYTNDFARRAETCQASLAAKNADAD